MTTAQQIIKRSDFFNRRVIDRKTVEELGKVDQLWVDPQSHHTIGFTCKSGFLGNKKRWFAWSQVETVGDNILVNLNPEVPELKQPESAMSMIGNEVLTDGGNKVGELIDYLFDVKTGNVVNYLFKSSGWRGVLDGIYLLQPAVISSIGSKRVMVPEAAIAEPHHYTDGLNQKVGQARDVLKKDLDDTIKHVEEAKGVAQSLAEKLQEKAKVVKEAAQDRAQVVREKAQSVREMAQDQAQVIKEKAQSVREITSEKIDEIRGHREEIAEQIATDAIEEAIAPQLPKDPE
ncbi:MULTISPECIES: PRC-barrel domain-containing protein [Kamptonema]|uniref:PRC-barrel domain-containing protein n=1 Tax=Kamptonema TaxID=1501433 RepID=UPI0001DAC1E5|nr:MULTISPECIES: PRC-barrel domain-containing protein [Kamptonema]CBN53633.1 hypothetical protein OSCI_60002 [Kamptonema sp. PCC 6506]